MKATQLELELWDQLRLAQQAPEEIDLAQMLDAVEATAAQLPEAQRLRFAGDALLQMADLCAARAGALMTQWEETHRDPIIDHGFFADVVRQTMAVDLSDLMEPARRRKPRTKRIKLIEIQAGSIVAPVNKTAVLALVEQLEIEAEIQKQQGLAIASDEDVTRWISEIAQWLQAVPEDLVSFAQLCHGLQMPWVEVWMGLLWGGFELEQVGEFYQSAIWVKRSSKNAAG